MSDDSDVEFIKPPNTLQAKIQVGGPNAVDEAALRRAERAIANMKHSYLEWVAKDFEKIKAAYARLISGEGGRQKNLDAIFSVSHDMKGQGGSFGYDLMTEIGNRLCRLIENFGEHNDADIEDEAIRIHIEAMKLVIVQGISGDGGEVGATILAEIRKLDEKLGKRD